MYEIVYGKDAREKLALAMSALAGRGDIVPLGRCDNITSTVIPTYKLSEKVMRDLAGRRWSPKPRLRDLVRNGAHCPTCYAAAGLYCYGDLKHKRRRRQRKRQKTNHRERVKLYYKLREYP